MEKQKKNFNEDLLDVIRIMIDKAMSTTTRIENGVSLGSVGSNKCIVLVNKKQYKLNVVGNAPPNGEVCKVFVPNGNFSAAFIMSGGDTESAPTEYIVGDGLQLLTDGSDQTLEVNLSELTAQNVEDMWDGDPVEVVPSNIPNNDGDTIAGSFTVGYGLIVNGGVLSINLDELLANDVETMWSIRMFQMASSLVQSSTANISGGDLSFIVGNGLKFENGVLFVALPELTASDVNTMWQT